MAAKNQKALGGEETKTPLRQLSTGNNAFGAASLCSVLGVCFGLLSATFITLGGPLGIAAMSMLIPMSCRRGGCCNTPCARITASVFCFVTAAFQLVNAILSTTVGLCGLYDCGNHNNNNNHNRNNNDNSELQRRYTHNTIFVLSLLSTICYVAAGVFALLMGAASTAPVVSSKYRKTKKDTDSFRSHNETKLTRQPHHTTTAKHSIHDGYDQLFYERNKLRQRGVPEHEINQHLPFVNLDAATTKTKSHF